MAITRLNSLAIPAGTVEPADISYPLTNFASTGIDDNATSTAITIDASENVGIGGAPTASSSYRTLNIIGGADVGGALRLSTTANESGHVFQYNNGVYLSGDGTTFISTGDPAVGGNVKTAYRVDRTAQLHRWYDPLDGTTERMRIDSAGDVGIGTTAPAGVKLNIKTATGSNTAIRLSDAVTQTLNVVVDGTATTGGIFYDNPNVGYQRWSTSNVERMRIDSSGNVGIGTGTPAAPLHVRVVEGSTGETDPIARFERLTTGDNAYLDITLDNSTNMVGFQSTGTSNGGFTFGGASSDLVTITSAGNVGIGGTPTSPLHVFGDAKLEEASPTLTLSDTTDSSTHLIQSINTALNVQGAGQVRLSTSATERMRIDASGNVGIGTSSVSPIISSSKTLQLNSSGNTTLSIRAIDSVNDRSAILELLSSGNGVSKSIILYGDTDTSPATASPLVIQKYHSGVRTEVGRFNTLGHLVLGDSTTAYYRLKSGATGTDGGIQWMFNTDATVFGSLTLPYDSRATTGLHLYSGYPITYTVPSNKAHQFVTGSAEAARIDADGIKFNGDTAAANGLDDYEEGNWTPNSTTRSGAFTIYSARYTRVGQTVTVHGYFDWVANNQNNNSNQQFFGGLPFDLAASGHYTAGVVGYSGGVDISDWYLVALPNTDNFYFTKKTTAANVTNAEMHSKGLRILIVTITYITDE